MLLLLFFVLIFVLTFGTMAVLLRASREQQLLERRFNALLPVLDSDKADPFQNALLKRSTKDTNPLSGSLGPMKPLRQLERLHYQSRGTRSVRSLLALMAILAVSVFGGVQWAVAMLPLSAAAAALVGALPIFWLLHLRQKRLKAFESTLPDCIDMCARALRAGYSLVAAIGIVAEQAPEPARAEFADVFRKQNYGLPVRDAFLETLERVPSSDLRVFVTGIMVQRDTGGNLTEIFDRIVLVIRERLRIKGEIRVHTAQGRMTAWILTLLPGALLLIINLIDPGYSRPMFQDPLGRKLMYAGSGLQLIGGLVVRRIVNGIEV